MSLIKLSIAAERLGVSNANLRARVAAGSLKVERCACGREWMVEEAEVDRYARENRRGRIVPPEEDEAVLHARREAVMLDAIRGLPESEIIAPETELERAAARG